MLSTATSSEPKESKSYKVPLDLPAVLDRIATLIAPPDGSAVGARAVVERLLENGQYEDGAQGDVFPSLVQWTTRHCGGETPVPVDPRRLAAAAVVCSGGARSYDEVDIASFVMWRTLDSNGCRECVARFTGRNLQFTLAAVARKLSGLGYADRGQVGTSSMVLGMTTPANQLFVRGGMGPVVVAHGSSPVLEIVIYLASPN